MTQLLTLYAADRPWADVALYCWPHNEVHQFSLSDVEKIVYALGASDWQGWDDAHMPSEDRHPQCLREVLRAAGDPEVYAEHVEQGVECRERSDESLPAGDLLDAERRGDSQRWYVACGCDFHGDHLGCTPKCIAVRGCSHVIGRDYSAATEAESDSHVHSMRCSL